MGLLLRLDIDVRIRYIVLAPERYILIDPSPNLLFGTRC